MTFKYNFTAVMELPAPPEKIYAILINPPIMGKYVPTVIDVQIVSEIKAGEGVVSRWRSKRPDGTIAEWNETIAVAESNKRMVFKYLELSDTQGEYLLSSTSEGHTKVTFTESMQKMISDEAWHKKHVKDILENIRRAVADLS